MASEPGVSHPGDPIAGTWHPPASSRAVAASLHAGADGTLEARSADGTVLAAAPGAAAAISDRVGSIARRVTFADGSVFETPDNDGIDAALRRLRRRTGLVHELERFRPRLVVFVVLIAALSAAIYRYAVPVLVELAVVLTPPVVPRLLSQSAMISLDGTLLVESGLAEERRQSISADFAALATLSPRGEAGYTLHFRGGGPIGPNAFALPDGTIVLTDELVKLAEDDAEAVLGVLAHEIGHVDFDHSLRRIYRAVGVTGLIMLIGGDIGAGAEEILVQGAALLSLSYSRDQEREADRHAVELMHAAGRDPLAITRFLELIRDKLGDSGRADSFLSSHPPTPERIEDTRRHAEEVMAGG